jgi:hypothetical protein
MKSSRWRRFRPRDRNRARAARPIRLVTLRLALVEAVGGSWRFTRVECDVDNDL